MNFQSTIITVLVLLLASVAAYSQAGEVGPIRASAAYSEVLLRKTQLQADLEGFLGDYTEQNPKIIDIRNELAAINRSMEKIFAVKPSDTAKLTLALGKLIVQQAAAETDLARLLRSYSNDNPQVKRAKRRVEIFENAVSEILK
jgi:hypothetical protein